MKKWLIVICIILLSGCAFADQDTYTGSTSAKTALLTNIQGDLTELFSRTDVIKDYTGTAAELNILDGVTSTAAELNLLDGWTSTQFDFLSDMYTNVTVDSGIVRIGASTDSLPGTISYNTQLIIHDTSAVDSGSGLSILGGGGTGHSYIYFGNAGVEQGGSITFNDTYNQFFFGFEGVGEWVMDETTLYPFTDNGADIGDSSHRVGAIYSYDADFSDDVDIGGDATIENSSPAIVLNNTTNEDTDGGRDSSIKFRGYQSGGESDFLGQIRVAHDGTSDDSKAKFLIYLNDGSSASSVSSVFKLDSDGNCYLGNAVSEYRLNVHAGLETNVAEFTGLLASTIRLNDSSTVSTITGKGGNVGINNTDPSADLDVDGDVEITGGLSVGGSSTLTGSVEIIGSTTMGIFGGLEQSSEPSDPADGAYVVWMEDGSGSYGDGDIMIKITAGGTTKTVTLVDFSAN